MPTQPTHRQPLEDEGGPILLPATFPYQPTIPEERIAAAVRKVREYNAASDTLKKRAATRE